MFVVAVAALLGTVEAEAPLLARDLGVAAYDAALLLRSIAPHVVLRTPDRARAVDLLGRLRARGHDTVACDVAAVVPIERMTALRSFLFDLGEAPAIVEGEERLALADVFVLLRATARERVETVEKTKERKFSLGRAALTGGLVMSKSSTKEVVRVDESREPLLFFYRRGGAPWVLRASHARYTALGDAIRPSQYENFVATVERVRALAPHAVYDERLATAPANADVDLLAHLLALSIAKRTVSAER